VPKKVKSKKFYLVGGHERLCFMSSPVCTEMGVIVEGIPSWYVTSHLGQLSLLPSAEWEMSTGQRVLKELVYNVEGQILNVCYGMAKGVGSRKICVAGHAENYSNYSSSLIVFSCEGMLIGDFL